MQAVILAGGSGTRLCEETYIKPKPMVEIGGKPILWHIMKIYSAFGINEFIICCGYKGYIIKEYFANYTLHMSDITFNMKTNTVEVHQQNVEPWEVTLVDTGENSMTGGRLLRLKEYIKGTFLFTYGDGLADINISNLVRHHKSENLLATITAVQPPGRYGFIQFSEDGRINRIIEKPQGDGGWINGGFFVLEPEVLDLIDSDSTIWEKEPLLRLVNERQLAAYRHDGFWFAMDTLRDKNQLQEIWTNGNAPWRIW